MLNFDLYSYNDYLSYLELVAELQQREELAHQQEQEQLLQQEENYYAMQGL